MKNKNVNECIKSGLAKISIDSDSSFLLKMKRKEYEKMRNKNIIKWFTIPTLVLSVFIAFFIFTNDRNSKGNISIISFDVNPSIEIKVDEKNKIVDVTALNDDGKKIIEGMDFSNTNLKTTINALMGSMISQGYIDEITNSLLITVENEDSSKAEKVRTEILKNINEYLSNKTIDASVLSQSIVSDSNLEKLAVENNISTGKANLINKIIENNSLFTFEELAKLSINELNILASKNTTSIEIVGQVSEKSYIGTDKVKKIISERLKVDISALKRLDIELDYDDGKMVYDVEFYYLNIEYDLEIDAKTGDIIKFESDGEISENELSSIKDNDIKYIGKEKAKEIALKHAKLNENNVKDLDIEFEYKNGIALYEIDFESEKYEYEYKINAITGKIIFSEKEYD